MSLIICAFFNNLATDIYNKRAKCAMHFTGKWVHQRSLIRLENTNSSCINRIGVLQRLITFISILLPFSSLITFTNTFFVEMKLKMKPKKCLLSSSQQRSDYSMSVSYQLLNVSRAFVCYCIIK